MTGALVGFFLIVGAWFAFEWDQRRISRDIDIDPVWDAFMRSEQRWR